MSFHSILFIDNGDRETATIAEEREAARDLNLDQIVAAITAGRDEYDLEGYFYAPLHDLAAIVYRQAVFRDLEDPALFAAIKRFAEGMRAMRRYRALADKLYYRYNQQGWFLEAAQRYCATVQELARDLASLPLESQGLQQLRAYLAAYIGSDAFTRLLRDTDALKAELASVRFCILRKGDRVRVQPYEDETDYSIEIQRAFAKFQQGAAKDYRVAYTDDAGINHIEAQILEGVAKLYPAVFERLAAYCAQHTDFLDATLARFDREAQFYLAYLEHITPLQRAGLPFCYPRVSNASKQIVARDTFDLALAHKLIAVDQPVVRNDMRLDDNERIMVVSGPNQGGKTTFARAFGQLHHLARLGCAVPGREAQLFLCDRIFTHFEQEEDISDLRSKLESDLHRIHAILEQATPNSIIILNEIFSSTTFQDALALSNRIMERIIRLDALCVWVTFIVELTTLSETIVSMVSTVVPDNPSERTFKIARRRADGLAYALTIAEKYGLTYECIKERIPA